MAVQFLEQEIKTSEIQQVVSGEDLILEFNLFLYYQDEH